MATYGTWVPIGTPPTEDAAYLYHCPTADPASPLIHIGWYTPGNGWTFVPSYWVKHITHWMPLPDPPTLAAGTPTGPEPPPRGGVLLMAAVRGKCEVCGKVQALRGGRCERCRRQQGQKGEVRK